MIRVGIISPSEIAFRRFLPALSKVKAFKFAGIAISNEKEWNGTDYNYSREQEKAISFIDDYGGKIFNGYGNMIASDEIDAIYLPLPPALHHKWAKQALMERKHVMIEKPATNSLSECKELIMIAKKNELAIHENYMFVYHSQIQRINEIVANGELGEVRLYRISFGFPQRPKNDFRYSKELGGGAILDCGGYTLKYASLLLGDTAKVVYAQSNYVSDFNVDIFGSSSLVNEHGTTVQIAFGMDNSYKCELEVWGSKGTLYTNRILTAPDGHKPELLITKGTDKESRILQQDDAFLKSIQKFQKCIEDESVRKNNYIDMLMQAKIVDNFIKKSKTK